MHVRWLRGKTNIQEGLALRSPMTTWSRRVDGYGKHWPIRRPPRFAEYGAASV